MTYGLETKPRACVELNGQPEFETGSRVQAIAAVRNDGTYPGKTLGEVLVNEGAVGFVRDVGTYLQRYYIYAVDFIDSERIVGMLGRELVAVVDSKNGK